MGREASHHRLSRALASFLPLTALSFCAAGCNTCFVGALNSPGTTVGVKIGNPPPPCTLTTTNGAVHIEIGTAAGTTSAEPAASANGTAASRPLTHLYVTLAGIDAHQSPDADDHSSEWQPLAPQLNAHPLQVDLLAPPRADGGSGPFPQAVVPAGVYRQVRLRLAMPPASAEPLLEANENEPVLDRNACGTGVLHCAVTSDGRIQPLAFNSQSVLRIPPESMEGRWLHVLPDAAVTLRIEFDSDRSFLWPSGDAFRLIPQFHLSVEPLSLVPEN